MRSRGRVLFLLSALALVASSGPAEANHDFFGRVSAGEINGNGDNINTLPRDLGGRLAGLLRHQRAAGRERHRHLRGRLRALRRARRRRSRPAAAPSTPSSTTYRPTARGSCSRRSSSWPRPTPTRPSTSTSAPAGRRRSSRGERSTATATSRLVPGASDDGSRIFFVTRRALVASDLDIEARHLRALRGDDEAGLRRRELSGNGPFPAILRGASADGSVVFFDTAEQLSAGDNDNSIDAYRRSGRDDDARLGGPINGNGAFDISFRGTSESGARAFFETDEQLVDRRRRRFAGHLRALRRDDEARLAGQINGNGAFDAFFAGASPDGSRVFFQTDEQLTTDDIDANPDIYERCGRDDHRVSAGRDQRKRDINAFFAAASDDGSRVFFFTSEQLVGTDVDGHPGPLRALGRDDEARLERRDQRERGLQRQAFAASRRTARRVFFQTSEQLVVRRRRPLARTSTSGPGTGRP